MSLRTELMEAFRQIEIQSVDRSNNRQNTDLSDQFRLFEEAYRIATPQILLRHPYRVDPYFLKWEDFFSPIESVAWGSIRTFGVPLYPQYPAMGFFLDFANPAVKVALEMDGKEWHNKEKDLARDKKLYSAGWRVFRVPGRECYTDFDAPIFKSLDQFDDLEDYENQISNWMHRSSSGVIYALSIVFFGNDVSDSLKKDAVSALEWHQSFPFPVQIETLDNNG